MGESIGSAVRYSFVFRSPGGFASDVAGEHQVVGFVANLVLFIICTRRRHCSCRKTAGAVVFPVVFLVVPAVELPADLLVVPLVDLLQVVTVLAGPSGALEIFPVVFSVVPLLEDSLAGFLVPPAGVLQVVLIAVRTLLLGTRAELVLLQLAVEVVAQNLAEGARSLVEEEVPGVPEAAVRIPVVEEVPGVQEAAAPILEAAGPGVLEQVVPGVLEAVVQILAEAVQAQDQAQDQDQDQDQDQGQGAVVPAAVPAGELSLLMLALTCGCEYRVDPCRCNRSKVDH